MCAASRNFTHSRCKLYLHELEQHRVPGLVGRNYWPGCTTKEPEIYPQQEFNKLFNAWSDPYNATYAAPAQTEIARWEKPLNEAKKVWKTTAKKESVSTVHHERVGRQVLSTGDNPSLRVSVKWMFPANLTLGRGLVRWRIRSFAFCLLHHFPNACGHFSDRGRSGFMGE